jgi:peptidyl-prolyl cis-trans isomerase C
MRGTPYLRAALFGLALTGLTAFAQTPGTTPPPKPTTPPPKPTTLPPATPAPKPATPAVSPTAVAATVNGHPIHETVVQRALERVPPARRAEVRPSLIEHLVNNLLIDLSLKAANYKVEPAEVDKRVSDMKAELKKVGRDFDKMLTELKVAEKELREHIEADLRWFKYAGAQATDKALSDLFNANKDMFDGTTVKAQHILVTAKGKDAKTAAAVVADLRQTKATIETEVNAALAKLPANTDKLAREKERVKLLSETFGKYAKQKSECPSKENGGSVGPFPKAGFMVAAFSNAAFALQPYQMSDVVQTPFGYHLILCVERKAGKEVKFEEVKEVVKEVFFDRLHESLASQLRQKASVVVNPPPK